MYIYTESPIGHNNLIIKVVRMKERDIPGLLELKMEYETKLTGMKDFQELKAEFDRSTMTLVKEAMAAKGIRLEGGRLPTTGGTQGLLRGSCGFCEVCITWG